jgi:putative FmdB family regulatory protein
MPGGVGRADRLGYTRDMPTYEYQCTSCGHHIEVFQRITEDPLTTCGVCGGPLRKVFHPAGIVFKGSGFYATDSRSSSSKSTSKKESDGGSSGGDGSGSKSGSGSTSEGASKGGSDSKSSSGSGTGSGEKTSTSSSSSSSSSSKDGA